MRIVTIVVDTPILCSTSTSSMIILVKAFSASRRGEKTNGEISVLEVGARKTPENYSRENPRSRVGTEKPNPQSTPSRIRTRVPTGGRRGKTTLRQPDFHGFYFKISPPRESGSTILF